MTPGWTLLAAVFSNSIVTSGSNDLSECTEFRNLSVSEGQDAVIYPDIQASENYSIRSSRQLMFELVEGKVKKQCSKCICKNSAAILQNIQLNETDIYTVKFNFTHTVCVNITVNTSAELPTPFVVPQDFSVGKWTTFDQKNENTTDLITGVAVSVVIGVTALTIIPVVWWQWKKIRTRCFKPSVGANSDPSVQYMQCNRRDSAINIDSSASS